jgi:hypothetical protein
MGWSAGQREGSVSDRDEKEFGEKIRRQTENEEYPEKKNWF